VPWSSVGGKLGSFAEKIWDCHELTQVFPSAVNK